MNWRRRNGRAGNKSLMAGGILHLMHAAATGGGRSRAVGVRAARRRLALDLCGARGARMAPERSAWRLIGPSLGCVVVGERAAALRSSMSIVSKLSAPALAHTPHFGTPAFATIKAGALRETFPDL